MGDWYVKQTIGRLPERAARQWGPREALAFQGRRWTFAQMHARVDAAAKGLLSLGIGRGDKVALWMVNRPEWIDAMFAIIKIGAVLVPVNTRFRTEDMAYILAQTDAAAVLLTDRSGSVDYFGMMREVVPALGSRPDTRFPCLRHVVVLSEGPLMSMVRGARQVLTETFDAGQCLDLIASERAPILHGFDTHYKELLDAQERNPRAVSSVRTGICAIDADGWFHTGDMDLMRPDGHMRFLGRYKDMLKIGGENVDPMEVEAFLMTHPAVNAASVVGLPDARLSEVALAFVQLAAGHALSEQEVIEHCRGRVASFKIPRQVVFVDEFPMTSSGKVQKVKLRERARQEWA